MLGWENITIRISSVSIQFNSVIVRSSWTELRQKSMETEPKDKRHKPDSNWNFRLKIVVRRRILYFFYNQFQLFSANKQTYPRKIWGRENKKRIYLRQSRGRAIYATRVLKLRAQILKWARNLWDFFSILIIISLWKGEGASDAPAGRLANEKQKNDNNNVHWFLFLGLKWARFVLLC